MPGRLDSVDAGAWSLRTPLPSRFGDARRVPVSVSRGVPIRRRSRRLTGRSSSTSAATKAVTAASKRCNPGTRHARGHYEQGTVGIVAEQHRRANLSPASTTNPESDAGALSDGDYVINQDFDASIACRTSHRLWTLADGPWVMTQTRHDLLFARP
jgi:hypothetical protein